MNRSGSSHVDDERPGGAGDVAADDGNAGSRSQSCQTVDERINARNGHPRRQHERQKGDTRRRAHGRKIAQIDGERLVTDIGRSDERLVEVYALDLRIGSQNLEQVSFGFDDRRVIPDADNNERRRWWDSLRIRAMNARALRPSPTVCANP